MKAFIINLDSATTRWSACEKSFAQTPIEFHRIPAVNGSHLRLPVSEFAERRYRWFHGRRTNPGEIGCYLSHIRAMQTFLETEDEHGLICEDDITFGREFADVLESALCKPKRWNLLRLTGLSNGTPVRLSNLCGKYGLYVNFGRLKGSGAYIVDRTAAKALVTGLVPMWLPFDHALDREWFFGLESAYVLPFPCSQTDTRFRSSIQTTSGGKQPAFRRWLATYPYQAYNEVARWLFRSLSFVKAKL